MALSYSQERKVTHNSQPKNPENEHLHLHLTVLPLTSLPMAVLFSCTSLGSPQLECASLVSRGVVCGLEKLRKLSLCD